MYGRQGPSCLGRLMVVLIAALGILLLLWGTGLINPLQNLLEPPEEALRAPGPAIVQQLRARNEWITYSYLADQMIEAERDGNALQDLLFGDRILLQARGEVAAGINMAAFSDDDIVTGASGITVTIPPAQVLYTRLDNEQTRVYDRQRGWLSKGDINLETNARIYAEQSILASACEAGVLGLAEASAIENVRSFFQSAGYEQVTVIVSPLPSGVTCESSANSVVNTSGPTLTIPTPSGLTPALTPVTPPSDGGLSGTAVPITP